MTEERPLQYARERARAKNEQLVPQGVVLPPPGLAEPFVWQNQTKGCICTVAVFRPDCPVCSRYRRA